MHILKNTTQELRPAPSGTTNVLIKAFPTNWTNLAQFRFKRCNKTDKAVRKISISQLVLESRCVGSRKNEQAKDVRD